MKIRDALKKYDKSLAKISLAYILDINFSQLDMEMEEELSQEAEIELVRVMELADNGIPIQYAIGKWDFYGRTFRVGPQALIPRPETELLVEEILKDGIKAKEVLDIGTGTGAIAISLALEEKAAKIWASDISIEALCLAMANARDFSARISFIESDLFDSIVGRFDVIVSNPPYISQEAYDGLDKVLFEEPKLALLAGPKGTEIYEKIIRQAKNYLREDGRIYFEIGYDQGEAISNLLEQAGFTKIEIIKDYGKKDRIVKAGRR